MTLLRPRTLFCQLRAAEVSKRIKQAPKASWEELLMKEKGGGVDRFQGWLSSRTEVQDANARIVIDMIKVAWLSLKRQYERQLPIPRPAAF